MAEPTSRGRILEAFRRLDSSGEGTCRREHLEVAIGRLFMQSFLASKGKADQDTVNYEAFLDWLFGSCPIASTQSPDGERETGSAPAPAHAVVLGSRLGPQEAWYAETRRAVRFRSRCVFSQLGWVRLRYLRGARGDLVQGRPLLRRQELPEAALVVGQAPPGVNWWVVSHPWLAKQHADITGGQLLDILDELDRLGACDEDVVFLDYLSMFQRSLNGDDDRTPEQKSLFKRSLQIINNLYSSPFCRVVIVTTIPESARIAPHDADIHEVRARIEPNSVPYIHRGWCYFELFVALLFQRHTRLDDDCLLAVEKLVADIFSRVDISYETDRASVQRRVFNCLTSTEDKVQRNDELLCSLVGNGTYVFIRAGYLRSLLRHRGVLQRRQDLPLSALVTNWRERRLYATLYTHLASNDHGKIVFDPDRVVLSELVQKLDILNADDEDGVFLDWASYPQVPLTGVEQAVQATAIASMELPFMSPRFQTLICHGSFQRRGIRLQDRAYPFMCAIVSAFSGSLVYDDSTTVDIFVEHIFMVALRTKVFTNGTEDMELVGNMFKTLLYQRAGITEPMQSS